MKLGEKIKFYREKKGYSLTALAQKAGIAKSTLHKIEENKTNPTINTLWSIATILEIPFGELVNKDYEIKEDNVSVTLIEKNDEIEVYKMTLLNFTSYISNPHFNGVTEQIYVIKGSVLVGDLKNPKLLNQKENFEFKADKPHIYKGMEKEVVLLVSIFYPKNYEKYFYEDRFIDEFNENYLKKIKTEIENGIDTIRIFAKKDNFDYKLKNIQIIKTNSAIFISKLRSNKLNSIKKYLKEKNFNLLENLHNKHSFAYNLLKNEISIIDQKPNNFISLNNDIKYLHPGFAFEALLISAFLNQFPSQKILYKTSEQLKNLINEYTQNKFIHIKNEEKAKIIISSLEKNLYEFLNNSYELLDNNGYLIVSDEFIPKYHTKSQREKNLILHYTSYMIRVMFIIENLNDQEKKLYELLRENIPYIRYLALNNEIILAKNVINQLSNQLKEIELKIENNLITYYLFIMYKFEELVNNLNLNNKTYYQNFIETAEEIGFEKVTHFNFYPTFEDGGTQLIILRKSE